MYNELQQYGVGASEIKIKEKKMITNDDDGFKKIENKIYKNCHDKEFHE